MADTLTETSVGPPDSLEDAEPPKRGRGRPKGSRNKPKDTGYRPADDTPATPRKAPARRRTPKVDIASTMEVSYTMIGQLWAIKDPQCGQVLMAQAPQIGAAWQAWADQSPRVKKVLEGFATGGAAIPVVVAHLPLCMAVMAHHGPQAQQARQLEQEAAANGFDTVEDYVQAVMAQQAAAEQPVA